MESLTLEDLANIGELIGSIGIVASLIYLGIQIKIQNSESRIAVITSLTEQWSSFMTLLASGDEHGLIWVEGLKKFPEMEDGKKVRFSAMMSNILHIDEALHKHHLDGKLDDDIWSGFSARMLDTFANPGAKNWWPMRRHWYSRRFQSYIDNLVDTPKEPTMYLDYGDT